MKLNQIVGITKILSDRKIPEDIEKYLESDYWSGSKKQFLKKKMLLMEGFRSKSIKSRTRQILSEANQGCVCERGYRSRGLLAIF